MGKTKLDETCNICIWSKLAISFVVRFTWNFTSFKIVYFHCFNQQLYIPWLLLLILEKIMRDFHNYPTIALFLFFINYSIFYGNWNYQTWPINWSTIQMQFLHEHLRGAKVTKKAYVSFPSFGTDKEGESGISERGDL